jgi:hypothetical protein
LLKDGSVKKAYRQNEAFVIPKDGGTLMQDYPSDAGTTEERADEREMEPGRHHSYC